MVGAKRHLDWWICADSKLSATTGLYVPAPAFIPATDGSSVSDCRFIEPGMGVRDRLCPILWLATLLRVPAISLTREMTYLLYSMSFCALSWAMTDLPFGTTTRLSDR